MGPYRIMRRVGRVSYELELPREMDMVHLDFYVSMLRKCVGDSSSIVPLNIITVNDDSSNTEVDIETKWLFMKM